MLNETMSIVRRVIPDISILFLREISTDSRSLTCASDSWIGVPHVDEYNRTTSCLTPSASRRRTAIVNCQKDQGKDMLLDDAIHFEVNLKDQYESFDVITDQVMCLVVEIEGCVKAFRSDSAEPRQHNAR